MSDHSEEFMRQGKEILARLRDELEEALERIRQLEETLAPEGLIPISLDLSRSERRILSALYKRAMCTKDMLHMASSPGNFPETEVKIVDVHICKIRRKLKPYGIIVETVWGEGYRLGRGARGIIDDIRNRDMEIAA